MSAIPFGSTSQRIGIGLAPNQPTPTLDANFYTSDVGLPDVLGLRLVAGRDFHADEVVSEEAFEKSADSVLAGVIG